jgi:quercetin dioxygenase-like cupin family protein
MESTDLSHSMIFPKGAKADKDHFIGDAWAETLVSEPELYQCMIWNVTFAPGARNNWHRHPGGQILLVTAGRGYYQEEGKPARELHPGDIVKIPPDMKHWHGASSDRWFVHIAIGTNPLKGGAEWLEPVSEIEYRQLK